MITKFKSCFFILLISFYVFHCIFNLCGYMFKYSTVTKSQTYNLFVIEKQSYSEDKISYLVKLEEGVEGKKHFNNKFLLNVYKDKYSKNEVDISKYSNYAYGDIIKVNGKIIIPKKLGNPGEFNYKAYLNSKGIYGTITTYQVESVDKDHDKTITSYILKKINGIMKEIENQIDNSLSKSNAALLKSMLYGDKQNLDEEVKQNFKDIGISHLMSASGSNLSTMVIIITIVLNKLTIKDKIKNILIIPAILFFMMLANFELAIMRAGIMAIISIAYKLFNRKICILKSLGISLLIILFINPMVILNKGLVLSFLATLSITIFYKSIQDKLELFTEKHIKNISFRRSLNYLVSLITITLSVQILILPIQLSIFNSISMSMIIANLIASILSLPIITLGILGIATLFLPIISSAFFSLTVPFLSLLILVVNILKDISINICVKSLPEYIYLIYYLIIGIVILKSLIKKNNKKSTLYLKAKMFKYILIMQKALIVLGVFLVVFYNIYSKYFDNFVYYFNVGQGEMSYISYKGKKIIVDMGSMSDNLAFNVISNYFQKENIQKVDIVVISHMHKDHVNGIKDFLSKYKVGQVIYAKPTEENDEYRAILKVIKQKNIETRLVKRGDFFELEDIQIKIMSPEEMKRGGKGSLNDNSIVCKIKVNETNLLYTGDITKTIEKGLVNFIKNTNWHVLKVAHHGSKSSCDESFISALKPKAAIISSKKSYYGHPREQVVTLLKKYNINTYITEKHGAIKIKIKIK